MNIWYFIEIYIERYSLVLFLYMWFFFQWNDQKMNLFSITERVIFIESDILGDILRDINGHAILYEVGVNPFLECST